MYEKLVLKNSNEILIELQKITEKMVKKMDKSYSNFWPFLLKIIDKSDFIKSVEYNNLKSFTSKMLTILVEINEISGNINVKPVNSIILKIIEKSNPTRMYKILIDLLGIFRKNGGKITNIVINMILTLTRKMDKNNF